MTDPTAADNGHGLAEAPAAPAPANGAAHVYGDHIDTDIIIPARLLTTRDPAELAQSCMAPIDPEFAARARVGDVMIGGANFGCGSSREHAVLAIQGAGIACVLAESFARIFFRNAINRGLPAFVCPGIAAAAQTGDPVMVDLATGRVETPTGVLQAEPHPPFLRDILHAGGLIPYVKRHGGLPERFDPA